MTPDPASESSKPLWARNWGPHKNTGVWGPIPRAPLGRPLPAYSFFSHSCQSELIRGCLTLELRGGTLTRTKWRHFMSSLSMLWLCTFQMGLNIYVSLLLLTPNVLSVPFDPQDNAFLSWAPTLHFTTDLTAGSAERCSLHQWKASLGGHLHFKEKTFSKTANTFDSNHIRCLFLIWWHLTTLRWTGATLCTLWT